MRPPAAGQSGIAKTSNQAPVERGVKDFRFRLADALENVNFVKKNTCASDF